MTQIQRNRGGTRMFDCNVECLNVNSGSIGIKSHVFPLHVSLMFGMGANSQFGGMMF